VGEERQEQDDDIVPVEMVEQAKNCRGTCTRSDEIINETIDDLHEIADFLVELRKSSPHTTTKLKA